MFTENQIKSYNIITHIANILDKIILPFKNPYGIFDSLLQPIVSDDKKYFKMIKDFLLAVPFSIYIVIMLLLVAYGVYYGWYESTYPIHNLQ